MHKSKLRSHLKQLRRELSSNERNLLSQRICQRLKKVDWSTAHTLHCFEPIAQLNEVDISEFITYVQTNYPQLQLYTSRHHGTEWRIVTWQNATPAQLFQFDTIIVPMLGFDSRLHRIGYGGGYYDSFLATQPDAKKIGVCFEIGKIEQIPTEPHDVSLDIIFTDTTVYEI